MFYLNVDSFQIGAKQIGPETSIFVFDFDEGVDEYLTTGTTDGQSASVTVPLRKLPGVSASSTWEATATEDGTDISACHAAPIPVG